MHRKFTKFHRLVATNTFRKVIRKKKNAEEKITWQVGDIEIEEGSKVLSKVMYRVCWLFVMKLFVITTIFFQLLLIEISDDCDPDEKTKDCFELKFWETGRLPNAPINCSSTVFVNGSVEVICYEVGFNISTAVGVSYGVLKTLKTVFKLLATLMLMKKTNRCVYTVQTLVVLSCVVFSIIIAVVQATGLRLSLSRPSVHLSSWQFSLHSLFLGKISSRKIIK